MWFSLIYLDTHVVVWLHVGKLDEFSPESLDLLNEQPLYISPIVRLELQYLYEIQRITDDANTVIAELTNRIGLMVCDKAWNTVVSRAIPLTWTRDPFDRLIVAHADLNHNRLISKDRTILRHYEYATW